VDAKLPIIVFGVTDVAEELTRLKAEGIIGRPDLDKPEWGIKNRHCTPKLMQIVRSNED
jgi:hypothetical protein